MEANDAADMMEQQKEENRFKKHAAILIAFFAMLLAVTSLGGNNATKEALNENVAAANAFNFFQAKNIRQTNYALAAAELELGWVNDPSLPEAARAAVRNKIGDYTRTVTRYESEPETGEGKKELLAKAREHAAKRDLALKQDPYFDYSEALLQIAIVLVSVSIVADQRWLSGIAAVLGVIGFLLMINGFLLLIEIPGLS